MKTRILDIALDCIVASMNDDPHWVFTNAELEKFGEMIVQECAEWINNNVGLVDEEAKADLLKHFD